MKHTQLLLIGHSHIQCVAVAQERRADTTARVDAIHLYRDKRVGNEPDFGLYIDQQLRALQLPSAPDAANRPPPADVVALFMGGNTHNTLGLVKMRPPFDYVLPQRPDLPIAKDTALVPEQIVQSALASRMQAILAGLDILAARFGTAAVCVESPPPIGDDDYVRHYLDEHFRKDFGEGRDIVPATLRYKLWRTSCSIFQARCSACGLAYLPTPPATLVDGMYLHPAGYPANVTHGNAWFGGHVLDALIERSRSVCIGVAA